MAKEAKVKTPGVEANKKAVVKETAEAAMTVKPTEAKKEEVKKAEPKKEEVKKAEPKKEADAPAKKAVKAKKAIKDKTPMVPEVFVQYTDNGEQEASMTDIIAKIKALYVADGHRESSIKSLKVYVKPQDWKAYYVINEKISGEITIF